MAKYDEKDYEQDLTAIRDERVIPVARKVLKLIADYDGAVGQVNADGLRASYAPLAKDILQVYLDHDIKSGDLTYIIELIGQMVQSPLGVVHVSHNANMERLEEKILGIRVADITYKQMDAILTRETPVIDLSGSEIIINGEEPMENENMVDTISEEETTVSEVETTEDTTANEPVEDAIDNGTEEEVE